VNEHSILKCVETKKWPIVLPCVFSFYLFRFIISFTMTMFSSISQRIDILLLLALLIFTAVVNVKALSVGEDGVSRRDALKISTLSGMSLLIPQPVLATETPSNIAPIAVIGANGRTGALCVRACLERGLPVCALTRSGSWQAPPGNELNMDTTVNNKLLTVKACDIKDPKALAIGLEGCRAVIYAASASKNGGTAQAIDNEGVVAAGNVCLAQNIGQYIIISSTAVTRPKSLGYIFTNVFGGIMEQKRLGEERVQTAYTNAAASSSSSYTIIRPGGLEEPKKNDVLGPGALEISQGDALAGIVSRADLAEVSVELAVSSGATNLKNTALELYYTDSAQPCERQFKSMMTNGAVPRLHGDTYAALFQGVQPNIDYYNEKM
jgi:uncharacterized protein YbjT (DUF2867 family)